MHLWRFVEYPSCRTQLFAQNRFHERPGRPWDFPLARAGTCQVLFMGGSGPFSAAYGALMSGTYALRAAYGVLMSRTCPLMDVPYASMGVPGLCMALACTEAVYAG